MEISDELAGTANIPNAASRVYKEECVLSFATPESDDGIFVDLSSFEAFSREHVERNNRLTGHRIYLNIKKRKVAKPKAESAAPAPAPRVLGLGVEGGFALDGGFEWQETYTIVLLPSFESVPFPSEQLPGRVNLSAQGVIQATSASMQDDVVAFSVEEKVEESRFANDLLQLDNGVKIPPKGWKCDVEGCGLTEGLWLNLSDGFVGCSRQIWSGGGGNGHALKHFEETGFPLSVKLGTICGDVSKIDIMSYSEGSDGLGGMVTDAKLVHHLAHWGIDISSMIAGEKSTKELELSMNEQLDLHSLEKHGQVVAGPGLTGMRNLGNSCYMNSLMQVLFSFPVFRQRYFDTREAILRAAPTQGAAEVLTVQLSKLADGLLSGNYCVAAIPPVPAADATQEEKEQAVLTAGLMRKGGIAPKMFKHLMGRDHVEFSTARQQDAAEYYQHVLQRIERADKADKIDPADSVIRPFQFDIEDRVQCSQSLAVRLTTRTDNLISLPVPEEMATNLAEVAECKKRVAAGEKIKQEDIVRPRIPFQKCLEAFAATEQVEDFYSSAIKGKTTALKQTRLATFPPILTFAMRKFYVDSTWAPQKMDCLIEVEDEIDLEFLRAKGLQPGETVLEDSGESSATEAKKYDVSIVAALMDMGIPEINCKKACVATKNAGAEQALNFVMENDMDSLPDPDGGSSGGKQVDEMALMQLISMGISQKHAENALRATDNNVERATEWVFSHDEDEAVPMEDTSAAAAGGSLPRIDGPAKYRLVACISHIGKSAQSGHYLCHIRKNGEWILFNDEIVAKCDPVPKELAYMYFFERI